jgi:hypothetical protein
MSQCNSVEAAAFNLPLPSINNATSYKVKHLDGAALLQVG